MQRLYPGDLKIERLAKLLAHPPTLEAIREGKPLADIQALWTAGRAAFDARREAFLLYR